MPKIKAIVCPYCKSRIERIIRPEVYCRSIEDLADVSTDLEGRTAAESVEEALIGDWDEFEEGPLEDYSFAFLCPVCNRPIDQRDLAALIASQPMAKRLRTVTVNLFAGPGAGKTVAGLLIAAGLKSRGYEAEYIPEEAKKLVWEGNLKGLDGSFKNQTKLYRAQLDAIERVQGKVDFCITDSPALLSVQYLSEPNARFEKTALLDYARFDNFNIFVQRGENYSERGRVHNREQALLLDRKIKDFLDKNGIYYRTCTPDDIDAYTLGMIVKLFESVNGD